MGAMYNQFKTVILLGLLTAVLLWVGSLWGSNGLIIALIFVLIMNFGTYFFSDKIVLKMYKAQPVKKTHWLYHLVHDTAKKAKLPTPKVYIIPGSLANAFATGRNPKHAAVACTEGILHLLNKEELKGVIAHELAHVKNRDILISTVAATIAGVIAYVAFMARFAAIFGGFRGRDSGNIIQLLVLAIVTPLIATIIQLAISRSREYLADSTGASIIKDGKPLASALHKLEQSAKSHHVTPNAAGKATAHMFIVNPFTTKGFSALFSTHPAAELRIKKLNEMSF